MNGGPIVFYIFLCYLIVTNFLDIFLSVLD